MKKFRFSKVASNFVWYATKKMRILLGPVFLNTSRSKRAVTCQAHSPPKWLLIPGITTRGLFPRQFYGVKIYAKRGPTFDHIARAPRKDPREILTALFHSGPTDVNEFLRKTGMNEKTLHKNLAKLKKGKTLKRKKRSGRPKRFRSSNRASHANCSRKPRVQCPGSQERITGEARC